VGERCPTCGQPWPQHSRVSDEAILRALVGGTSGRNGTIPHQLYAAALASDTRLADTERWYLTGPRDRPGFVRGPFPLSQVDRLAKSGRQKADVTGQDGTVQAWILAK
jgi:hypothetical protein